MQNQPIKVTSVEMVLVQEADYSRPYNGDNGNYDIYEMVVNGKTIAEFSDCDWSSWNKDGFWAGYAGFGYTVRNGQLWELWEDGVEREERLVDEKRFEYLTTPRTADMLGEPAQIDDIVDFVDDSIEASFEE